MTKAGSLMRTFLGVLLALAALPACSRQGGCPGPEQREGRARTARLFLFDQCTETGTQYD
jgi:hypothetical protein